MTLFPNHRNVIALLLVSVLFAFGAGPALAQSKASAPMPSAMSPAERKSIEGVVRDLLMKNPEIIIEAIQIMREREQREYEREQRRCEQRQRQGKSC